LLGPLLIKTSSVLKTKSCDYLRFKKPIKSNAKPKLALLKNL